MEVKDGLCLVNVMKGDGRGDDGLEASRVCADEAAAETRLRSSSDRTTGRSNTSGDLSERGWGQLRGPETRIAVRGEELLA